MKILLIKMSSMGDIIHTLPAVTDLMYAMNNITLDWIVEEDFSLIPTWHQGVNNVILISLRRWKKNFWKKSTWIELREFILNIRKNDEYDLVLDAQSLLKSAVLLINIKNNIRKCGFSYMTCKEFLSGFFYNQKYYIDKNQHAIYRIRKFFSQSVGYVLPNNITGSYGIDKKFVRKILIHDDLYLIFLYATTWKKKYWPVNFWRQILDLSIKLGYKIKFFWGNDKEYYFIKKLSYGYSTFVVDILPKLNLEEIANQLINAHALLSIDTGLSHLAAALNCPNLTLYGPTNPYLVRSINYTYSNNQKILIAENKNMNNLSVEKVWRVFKLFL